MTRAGVVVLGTLVLVLAGCSQKPPRKRDRAPRRIVTLTPSSTEIVAAVAGSEVLVGVDRYSIYPAEVADLPKVGDFLNPSFEAILALRPDLVVLDEVQAKVVDGLTSAGIATMVLDMHTIADVRAALAAVGDAVAEPARARLLIDAIDREVDAVTARAAARPDRLRVLAVVDRQQGGLGAVVAAGPGSYIDELLALVGVANVMERSTVRYSNITAEQILRGRPDVILDSVHAGDHHALADWDALAEVPAVRDRRIYSLTDYFYQSPSPRVGEALRGLEAMLYAVPD